MKTIEFKDIDQTTVFCQKLAHILLSGKVKVVSKGSIISPLDLVTEKHHTSLFNSESFILIKWNE